MEQAFKGYIIEFAAVVLCTLLVLSRGDGCQDDPVLINEEFLTCCKGRPMYSSENCIDAMLERSKFSPECLLDCLYKEVEIYDGVAIDLPAVKIFLDSKISNVDFNLVYMNAFERCSQIEKSTLSDIFSFVNITNVHGCDEYSHYVDVCVWYYTVVNCPEKYSTTDEMCQAKRAWVEECILA